MKYMVNIYGDHETWSTMTEEMMARMTEAHADLQRDLTASGELIDTNELSVTDARVLRSEGGVMSVTDGPFIEGKEIVGGYYLLECASIDRAVEIAGRLVEWEFAPIDVR